MRLTSAYTENKSMFNFTIKYQYMSYMDFYMC